MALASLDIVSILKRELKQFECPASTVASLAGISGSKLTSYLNEVNRCPVEHELKLRGTWALFKKLIEYARPLRLDYRKVGELRRCIDLLEDGRLQIVVFENGSEQNGIDAKENQHVA